MYKTEWQDVYNFLPPKKEKQKPTLRYNLISLDLYWRNVEIKTAEKEMYKSNTVKSDPISGLGSEARYYIEPSPRDW